MQTVKADQLFEVLTTCPNCGESDSVFVRLDAKVEKYKAESYLSVRAGVKKIEHACGQTSILVAVHEAEGEPPEMEIVVAEIVDETPALPWVDPETGEILGGGPSA